MKTITIHQEGTKLISINDDDEEELETYSKKLSSILENNNISILQTKFTSVITRPSKIISIVIKEMVDTQKPIKTKSRDVIHSKKKEPGEQDEYTLTDED